MWRRNACLLEDTEAGISVQVGDFGTGTPSTAILEEGAS